MAVIDRAAALAAVKGESQVVSPSVSIVVPVHNGARCIERCLESVEAQTFKNFEVICIDDGSTDETLEVLDLLQARWNNVQVIAKSCGGVSSARNSGMDAARGKYLLFVDADDTVEPNLLEEVLAVAEATNAQMTIFGFSEYYGADNVKVPREMCSQKNLIGRAFVLSEVVDTSTTLVTPNVWRILFERSFLTGATLCFHEDLQTSEDLAFIYEALLCAPRIALENKRLYKYHRDDAATLTRNERGVAGLRALDHIRCFGEDRGGFDDVAMRHFVNLILDTLRYALSTAYSAEEFQALYDGYRQDWVPLVSLHEDVIAPRYRAFYDAMSDDSMSYLFGLYSQERLQLERTKAQLASVRDELGRARETADELRRENKRLGQKPLNRVVRRLRRLAGRNR